VGVKLNKGGIFMSKYNTHLFVSDVEFEIICEKRIDDVRQSLYNTILLIREDNPNYGELSERIKETMLDLARVQNDLYDTARRNNK
jgi:hypothetical protein